MRGRGTQGKRETQKEGTRNMEGESARDMDGKRFKHQWLDSHIQATQGRDQDTRVT